MEKEIHKRTQQKCYIEFSILKTPVKIMKSP